MIDNDVVNGFIPADSKPAIEQVCGATFAAGAVKAAGGRITVGKCSL